MIDGGQDTLAHLAEYAGAEMACAMLDAILQRSCQADRMLVLCETLAQLSEECDHRDRAIGGFAVQLVNVIEQGLGVGP